MQIQTWHPPVRFCTHARHYVKSGLTNVLKNANKTKNTHLFSIWMGYYNGDWFFLITCAEILLVLLHFSLTVKAATLIFMAGCASAISSAKEEKSGSIYNLVNGY